MEPAQSIGKLGFRRWYERQLLESHAWLVTCLLAALAAFALIEGLDFKAAFFTSLTRSIMAFVAGLLSWLALYRYAMMLTRANALAQHAVCRGCGAYGRFEVLDGEAHVRCRGCRHEWQLK